MTCATCDKYDKWIARLTVPILGPGNAPAILTDEEMHALLLFLRDERDVHGDRDSAALFR
jgi:hypothetical protein